jgi:hypothetical protein
MVTRVRPSFLTDIHTGKMLKEIRSGSINQKN